jgi:hypothetical protein
MLKLPGYGKRIQSFNYRITLNLGTSVIIGLTFSYNRKPAAATIEVFPDSVNPSIQILNTKLQAIFATAKTKTNVKISNNKQRNYLSFCVFNGKHLTDQMTGFIH